MYNSLTTWVARVHIDEQLKKAQAAQLAKIARQQPFGLNQRLGLAVSDMLIAAGEKLRQRYDPGACDTCYETL